jgi:hypothetical protein
MFRNTRGECVLRRTKEWDLKGLPDVGNRVRASINADRNLHTKCAHTSLPSRVRIREFSFVAPSKLLR